MTWEEIKKRLNDGETVEELAEAENVPYKTMLVRIRQHERKDGMLYIAPSQLRKKEPEVIDMATDCRRGTTVFDISVSISDIPEDPTLDEINDVVKEIDSAITSLQAAQRKLITLKAASLTLRTIINMNENIKKYGRE